MKGSRGTIISIIIIIIIITIIVIGVNKVTVVNRSKDRVIELQKEFPGTFYGGLTILLRYDVVFHYL